MSDKCNATSSGIECQACVNGLTLPFWCETCRVLVNERRCLNCGLKTRKVRNSDSIKSCDSVTSV
jgi:Zn ribbon nucleic-acid-binding protein